MKSLTRCDRCHVLLEDGKKRCERHLFKLTKPHHYCTIFTFRDEDLDNISITVKPRELYDQILR